MVGYTAASLRQQIALHVQLVSRHCRLQGSLVTWDYISCNQSACELELNKEPADTRVQNSTPMYGVCSTLLRCCTAHCSRYRPVHTIITE